jgi:hypothetical protein
MALWLVPTLEVVDRVLLETAPPRREEDGSVSTPA